MRAYEADSRIILDIQHEFYCQGFDDSAEFTIEMSEFFGVLPACKYPLIDRFGSKMYSIGIMTMLIRMFQFAGIFLLSVVLHQLRIAEDSDEEEAYMMEPSNVVLLNDAHFPSLNEKYDLDHDTNSVHLISFNDEEKLKEYDTPQSIVTVQVPAVISN
ncbi:hypothetical protein BGW37DRAFT_515438 [Umbelopsis sp. PMI_123]|nr:hypothetical protein BGW37DRAFT_515438 [Umbelopsis sp. PMI_123]